MLDIEDINGLSERKCHLLEVHNKFYVINLNTYT